MALSLGEHDGKKNKTKQNKRGTSSDPPQAQPAEAGGGADLCLPPLLPAGPCHVLRVRAVLWWVLPFLVSSTPESDLKKLRFEKYTPLVFPPSRAFVLLHA